MSENGQGRPFQNTFSIRPVGGSPGVESTVAPRYHESRQLSTQPRQYSIPYGYKKLVRPH